jgi:hypothetical protein
MNIKSGTLVLVEVHGLPDNQVKNFTYMGTRPLYEGELIHVPAPAWSIPVTGRDTLPGFVLGESTDDLLPSQIRTIRSATTEAPVPPAITAMITAWAEEARAREGHAAELIVLAQQEQDKALRLLERIREVERALEVH